MGAFEMTALDMQNNKILQGSPNGDAFANLVSGSNIITLQDSLQEKLAILSDAAKYDVACTSSGTDRLNDGTGIGNALKGGICHSFTPDGRCVTLLKVLFSNECIYDCKYCYNRSSNDIPRTSFTPDELCTLVIEFYRRNYIEGLFLSSGVLKSPNFTMELMYITLHKLRHQHNFQGYIHIKAIPGTDLELVQRLGFLTDRLSVNLELPTADSLKLLAPHKSRKHILEPMRLVQNHRENQKNEVAVGFKSQAFVPAGQSTQMIIGATPETDYQIMSVAENLYDKFDLKRVFYSAYIPINHDKALPALVGADPPMLREHRLYQADWLLRFYHFKVSELLDEKNPNFNVFLDPKCNWALKHLEHFPVEVNHANYKTLLRVPGIGVKSAERIIMARRLGRLEFKDLKKMGVVLKRALYFITCNGRMLYSTKIEEDYILRNLLNTKEKLPDTALGFNYQQLSLFDTQRFAQAQNHVPLISCNV